jgi:hypothetical protein
MTQLVIPTVWLVEGDLLVSASTLSGLVRQVAHEVAGWDGEAADPQTVRAVDRMLQNLADRIDADCIALISSVADGTGRHRAQEQ